MHRTADALVLLDPQGACSATLSATTATVRHARRPFCGGSATSLAFEGATVPPYYDPAIGATWSSAVRLPTCRSQLRGLIEQLRAKLADVLVLTNPATAMTRPRAPIGPSPTCRRR